MKITEDRLAVALAVLEKNGSWLLPDEIRAVIAAIPEPEPQIKYGCHCEVEVEPGSLPDACVFDNGDVDDCIYAVKLQREGKGKLACEFWKPINPPAEPPDDSPATLPAGGWVVMDGDGKHYRTWRDGFPAWTSEAGKATRYLRREDAEAVHYEDEGAWLVVPQQSEPLPAPTGPGWWFARLGKRAWNGQNPDERWHAVRVEADKFTVLVTGDHGLWRTGDFDAWVGPLVAPTAKGGVE